MQRPLQGFVTYQYQQVSVGVKIYLTMMACPPPGNDEEAATTFDRAGVPRRKRVPLSTDDVVDAVRLYESGLPIMQVAVRFEQKYQSMRQALLQAGVQMRPPVAER